ncbi:SRPBCC family protein [Levilactobacillus yiduensis]|uniref:SRPBCC family protein n=1 Tax=Levilactobacillus yiduensis TaxID=2953880 RepID=UPI000EF2C11C|nr:SRPBCC family protein [Levilactobacillus yiduensis]AYM02587.1 SRPBCC family protein [Levilactobacillus brevis]
MSNQIIAQASATVNAPAAKVYTLLATPQLHATFQDKPFYDFKVENDIQGAGAVVSFKIDFAGGAIAFRMVVTEPEPGHTLVWTDTNDSGLVTTYTVTDQGEQSMVTISSQWDGQSGVIGAMEKFISPMRMKSVYKKELDRINAYVQNA